MHVRMKVIRWISVDYQNENTVTLKPMKHIYEYKSSNE